MGKLRVLELENFKSYAGKTVVGPFDDFTCIIGPNGAGKSNIMDAISFVLGVQSKHLRSSTLKELLYRKDSDAVPARRASVKLIYEVSEGEIDNAPAGAEITFMRQISATGVSTYKLDDKDVTFEIYEQKLQKIGVLVRVRNFLVFQGDIESIASKNPREITKLLEQISGSDALAAEYDSLERQKKEAEDSTIFALQKKKMYASQRKEVKDQKEEADEFQLKQEELGAIQTQQVLQTLWTVKKKADGHKVSVHAYKQELEAMGEEEELNNKLGDGKRNLAKSSKALAAAEKEYMLKFKTASATAGKLEETQAKVRGVQKRGGDLNKALKAVQNEHTAQKGLTRDLEARITETEAALARVNTELEELSAKGLHLNDENLAEYNRLRGVLAGMSAGDLAEESITDQEVRSREMQTTRLRSQIATIRAEEAPSQALLDEHSRRLELLQGAVKTGKEAIATLRTERDNAARAVEEGAAKVEQLESELAAVSAKLADSGEQRSRSKREQKLDAAIDSMQRIFTGVFGKLHDLCKPIQKKYAQAITVAAGKHMHAVVVESASVAQECIRYLKDQRAGTCVFLPLNSLEYKAPPDRLRQYAPRYKMCVDLLECEDRFKPALSYAVGATVVCETLQEAQELAFTHHERVKVVTITGAVISKSGAMTGGAAQKEGENKFEEREIEALRAKKSALDEKLAETRRLIPTRQALVDMELRMKSQQTRLSFSEADAKVTETKIKEIQTNTRAKAGAVKDLEKEVGEAAKAITSLTAKLTTVRGRIANTEKEVFGAFSESVGIDNIRDYERRYLRSHRDLMKRKEGLSEALAGLQAQLAYEKKRDVSGAEARVRVQIDEARSSLEALEGEVGALLSQDDAARKATRAANEKALQLREIVAKANKDIKALQVRVAEQLDERNKKATLLAKEEILLERCKKELRETMLQAQMDEVHLPTERAGASQSQSQYSSSSSSSSSSGSSSSQGDEELQMTVTEVPSQRAAAAPASSSSLSSNQGAALESGGTSSGGGEVALVTYTATVDLSSVDSKLRGLAPQALASLKAELQQQADELVAEIAEMRPNLHASGRLDSVQTKLKEIESELETARDRARDFGTRFESCRDRRVRLFEECFEHVSKALQVIYRDLTKSSKHPMGGTAFLTLDDQNEPYAGGTRYTAMPPMKRFRDMEQLSGGEKTMAALALLFSIHSFRQAPFFVLDEVDAALDNVNVKKICNYIKQRSREFQCIVISLKDSLFEHADSLVGVAKDVNLLTSRVYTLDMRAFESMSLSTDRGRDVSTSAAVDTSATSAVGDESTMLETTTATVGGGRVSPSAARGSAGTAIKKTASRASPAGSVASSSASSATHVRASPSGGPPAGKRKFSEA
jgi:structural maintenance of chromosome 1